METWVSITEAVKMHPKASPAQARSLQAVSCAWRQKAEETMESLLDNAKKAAQNVQKAAGLPCSVVISENACTHELGNPVCEACRTAQKKIKGQITCRGTHTFAITQALRWGGRYEYLCPASLCFMSASIVHLGGSGMALIAGPFAIMKPTEYKDDADGFFLSETPKEIMRAPYLPPEKVNALGDLIFMCAAYVGSKENVSMMLKEEAAREHTRLFENIYGMKGTASPEYPVQQEKLLLHAISQGDRPTAQRIFNELLGSIFFASGGDFNRIRSRALELLVLLSRAAIDGGADSAEILGLNEKYIQEMGRYSTIEDMALWLSGVLTAFSARLFDAKDARHSATIRKVAAYIRRNYMRKITLNDISDHVHFSVSYLSKLFKEEMDINLSNYINLVRVENCKMLLMDRSVPLADIAYMSGFEDQSYFSKVFKKISGMTPGRYREQCG